MLLPGWNSLDSASRFHSLFEIAGIVLLALLVLAETLAYQYGHRSDDLLALQQDATEKNHEEEMGRLHRDTAALTADAEKSRAAVAGANARSLEAQVELARYRAGRSLSEEQKAKLAAALKDSSKGPVIIKPNFLSPEPTRYANELSGIFNKSGFSDVGDKPLPGIVTYNQPGLFLAFRNLGAPPRTC